MAEKNEKNPATDMVERFSGRIMPMGEITYKKMFGGYGVFESGTMFALVTSDGEVYLKAGEANRIRFEQAEAKKHSRMPYYQIPEPIFTDDSQLMEWAQEAIEISKSAKK